LAVLFWGYRIIWRTREKLGRPARNQLREMRDADAARERSLS
jgi:hypothetical protein